MYFADSRGWALEATGPQGACSTDGSSFVHGCHPFVTDQPSRHEKALQDHRRRERLEIEALAAQRPRPEQVADRQLQGVRL